MARLPVRAHSAAACAWAPTGCFGFGSGSGRKAGGERVRLCLLRTAARERRGRRVARLPVRSHSTAARMWAGRQRLELRSAATNDFELCSGTQGLFSAVALEKKYELLRNELMVIEFADARRGRAAAEGLLAESPAWTPSPASRIAAARCSRPAACRSIRDLRHAQPASTSANAARRARSPRAAATAIGLLDLRGHRAWPG